MKSLLLSLLLSLPLFSFAQDLPDTVSDPNTSEDLEFLDTQVNKANSAISNLTISASSGSTSIGIWTQSGNNIFNNNSGNVCIPSGGTCQTKLDVNGGIGQETGNSYFLGSVGFGTISPQTNLDVTGNFQWGSGSIKSTGTTNGSLNLAPGATFTGNIQSPYHLGRYTVASAISSASDKARADYVGDGVHDEVAIMAAFAAATSTASGYTAEVELLPGGIFTLSTTTVFDCNTNGPFVLNAQGTTINAPGWNTVGPTNTTDAIYIKNCVEGRFNFGLGNSTGTANFFHLTGFNQSELTYQALVGSSHMGTGIYIDAVTTNNNVDRIIGTGGPSGFNHGIEINRGTGSEDTFWVKVDYMPNNKIGIYEHGSQSPVANTWNVNIDCTWSAASICIESNAQFDVYNVVMGQTPGSPAIQFDSGGCNNIVNETPLTQVYQVSGIVDNSGCSNNRIEIGATTSTPTLNSFAYWGSNPYQLNSNSNLTLSGNKLFWNSGVNNSTFTVGSSASIWTDGGTAVFGSTTANNAVIETNGGIRLEADISGNISINNGQNTGPQTLYVNGTLGSSSLLNVGTYANIVGSATVQGNAFSVGASTFSILSGNTSIGGVPAALAVGTLNLHTGTNQDMGAFGPSSLSDGISFQFYNDLGSANVGFEVRSSTFQVTIPGGSFIHENQSGTGFGVSNPLFKVDTGSYEQITNACTAVTSCTATCSAGKQVVGGGCTGVTSVLADSIFGSKTTWVCTITLGNVTAGAICMNIN